MGIFVSQLPRRPRRNKERNVRHSEGLIVTLKVRASLLSGCLQMMMTQTAQSRHKMTQGTTMPGWPASISSRQLAMIMHSTVMRTAAGREDGGEVSYNGGSNIQITIYLSSSRHTYK